MAQDFFLVIELVSWWSKQYEITERAYRSIPKHILIDSLDLLVHSGLEEALQTIIEVLS